MQILQFILYVRAKFLRSHFVFYFIFCFCILLFSCCCCCCCCLCVRLPLVVLRLWHSLALRLISVIIWEYYYYDYKQCMQTNNGTNGFCECEPGEWWWWWIRIHHWNERNKSAEHTKRIKYRPLFGVSGCFSMTTMRMIMMTATTTTKKKCTVASKHM